MSEHEPVAASPTSMSTRAPSFTYRLYGLDFQTSEPIPNLELSSVGCKEPIVVEFGPVPARLAEIAGEDEIYQVNEEDYLACYPGLCRAIVSGGKSIRFEALGELEPAQRWYSALSLAASVAGIQRGHYPLHASVARVGSGAAAFCAPSGSGKSTLLAGLINRGFRLLSDDLCLIQFAQGNVYIEPGPPDMRLLPDALPVVGWSHVGAPEANATKAIVSHFGNLDGNDRGRIPLSSIYALSFCEPHEPACIRQLSGTEAMKELIDNVRLRMRVHLFPERIRRSAFEMIATVVRQTRVYRFVRPRDHRAFDRHLDMLASHLADRA